jgi:hypothetical protein
MYLKHGFTIRSCHMRLPHARQNVQAEVPARISEDRDQQFGLRRRGQTGRSRGLKQVPIGHLWHCRVIRSAASSENEH